MSDDTCMSATRSSPTNTGLSDGSPHGTQWQRARRAEGGRGRAVTRAGLMATRVRDEEEIQGSTTSLLSLLLWMESGAERDEMKPKTISLNGYLRTRGEYIFVWWIQYVDTITPRSVWRLDMGQTSAVEHYR
jgi:hypothetical protein